LPGSSRTPSQGCPGRTRTTRIVSSYEMPP
jgi:hypothetical protein